MPPHVERLRNLAQNEANGEFIVACDGQEIHVYLQQGRVAWGTSSARRFGFMRHLLDACDIDEAAFDEVLETCRRESRPLGETLVEWGLASDEQVRAALEAQVVDSLRDLACIRDPETLFLRRNKFAEYDKKLTFQLESLLSQVDVAEHEAPSNEHVGAIGSELAERLVAAHSDVLWVEVAATASSIRVPKGRGIALGLMSDTLTGAHADLVAIRAGVGTILGVAVPEPACSVWCGLNSESSMGHVLAALATQFGLEFAPRKRVSLSLGPWRGIGADHSESERILDFAERATGLRHVIIFDENAGWGGSRSDNPLEHETRIRAHATLLQRPDLATAINKNSQEAESLGYRYRSMVVGERDCWSYLAEVPGDERRLLWMCLERTQSQGLGWALLSSLLRELAG